MSQGRAVRQNGCPHWPDHRGNRLRCQRAVRLRQMNPTAKQGCPDQSCPEYLQSLNELVVRSNGGRPGVQTTATAVSSQTT